MKKNIGTLEVSIIVVIILLFTNVIPASSLLSIENTTFNETIKLEYNFNAPDIKIIDGYSKLSFEDSCIINNPGEPQIPFKSIKVLVPKNSIEFEIYITFGEKIIIPGFHVITPGQNMYPNNYTGSIEPTPPNPDIYQSEDIFPGFSYENIGLQSFRGYDFLIINLYPIQYLPIKGEVYYYDKMNIQISPIISESIENKFFRNINKDVDELKTKIENPDLIGCYQQTKKATNPPLRNNIVNPEDSYDLVIVTSEELKNSNDNYTFQDLIFEKSNIGISATIVTIEEILSCPDYSCNGFWGDGDGFNEMFNDTQAKIRNFIRDAYANWETEYVLLGGDNSSIPARIVYFGRYHNNDVFGPSDMYYSCLEGNYNSDGDGKWAENLDGMDTPNGNNDVDLIADVYVGRASIDTSDELDHFINKTIIYMNADDPYLNDVLMVGEYLGPEFAADYMDELINESSNNDYYTVGIPADDFSYNISKLYGRDYPGGHWPREEVITRINKGNHIINHLGHAGYGLNMRIWRDLFDSSITNTKHSFIYSQGCYSGAFEVDDCIAEHFTIKSDYGAFAGIWNARSGFHTGSFSTDSPSQRFHRSFWDAVFGENITVISKANQDSKEDNLGMINGGYMRWVMYGLNLLGDPSLEFKPIWRGEHNICVKRMNLGKNHITTNQTIIVNYCKYYNSK